MQLHRTSNPRGRPAIFKILNKKDQMRSSMPFRKDVFTFLLINESAFIFISIMNLAKKIKDVISNSSLI